MITRVLDIVRKPLARTRWVMLLLVGSNLVYVTIFWAAEKFSYEVAMWWGWVTGFTIGYGDIFPATAVGCLVAVADMATNWLLLSFLQAHIFRHVLIDSDAFDHAEQELIKWRLARAEQLQIRTARLQEAAFVRQYGHGALHELGIPPILDYLTDEDILAELRLETAQA